jgi:hypothetical protein
MNTERGAKDTAVAFDGAYYAVVQGTGRRWLVVDKLNGAVLDEGTRSCMVMFASFVDRTKELREAGR